MRISAFFVLAAYLAANAYVARAHVDFSHLQPAPNAWRNSFRC